ncbi:MAG: hypothetical protein ACJ763_19460 [Bdellovibrionia bacterium]
MRILVTVLASMIASQAFATDTGFEAGNTFTVKQYHGTVSVMCMAPNDHGNYIYACHSEDFQPGLSAKFVTAPGVDADHVTLTSMWEGGKTVTKDAAFDSVSGKSGRAFNLWISTLLQRPLLDQGTNIIHYALSKNGKIQSEGGFIATVKALPDSQCSHQTLIESGNCQNLAWMCERYFNEVAQCE